MDTEPVITFLMDLPSGFAPEPDPLPFATYRVRPSGETASAVGYHPTGMSPATRMCLASSRTRSEERRVGKECRSRWWPDREKKKRDTTEPQRAALCTPCTQRG